MKYRSYLRKPRRPHATTQRSNAVAICCGNIMSFRLATRGDSYGHIGKTRHDTTRQYRLGPFCDFLARVSGLGEGKQTRTEEYRRTKHETDKGLNHHGSARAISSELKRAVVTRTSSSRLYIVTMTRPMPENHAWTIGEASAIRPHHPLHVLRTHRR